MHAHRRTPDPAFRHCGGNVGKGPPVRPTPHPPLSIASLRFPTR
ncbi:hypothetical protein C7S15_5131 [Burkholderia cepacia]|nr:hypothetical protein [Burkholderia cepacia]